MKSRELLNKYPMRFLVWNLNEDTGVFWSDLTTLEDNGFFDPWGRKLSLAGSRRNKNSVGDTISYTIESEFQGYPVEIVIMNE